MEKKQIKTLLDHGELDLSPDFNAGSMSFLSIGEISYHVSQDVVDVAWHLFYEKIKDHVEWESDIFQQRILDKLVLYPPVIEDKVFLLRKTIIKENEKLESLNDEIFKGFEKMEMDFFYPLAADHILNPKFVGDWVLNESFLEILKFDLFKGAKINVNDMPEICIDTRDKLDGFFETNRTKIPFEIVAHTNNILYLKKLIEDLENENVTEVNHEGDLEQKQQDKSNSLHSKIDSYLCAFKDRIDNDDYTILVQAIEDYFRKGEFPKLIKNIKVAKVNKKRFGWALNQIYRSQKNDPLPFEYLLFAKENISLFVSVDPKFNEKRFRVSNTYKYFTKKQP